jgi:hypothetical protein
MNLRSWKPGQSGNPSGLRKVARFHKTLKAVLTAKKDCDGISQRRLRYMLTSIYDQTIELVKSAENLRDLMAVIPFLELIRDTLDGKPKELEAKREDRVVYLEGGETRHETVETLTEIVRLETEPHGRSNSV